MFLDPWKWLSWEYWYWFQSISRHPRSFIWKVCTFCQDSCYYSECPCLGCYLYCKRKQPIWDAIYIVSVSSLIVICMSKGACLCNMKKLEGVFKLCKTMFFNNWELSYKQNNPREYDTTPLSSHFICFILFFLLHFSYLLPQNPKSTHIYNTDWVHRRSQCVKRKNPITVWTHY